MEWVVLTNTVEESGLADLRSCNNGTRLIDLFFIAIDFFGFIDFRGDTGSKSENLVRLIGLFKN